MKVADRAATQVGVTRKSIDEMKPSKQTEIEGFLRETRYGQAGGLMRKHRAESSLLTHRSGSKSGLNLLSLPRSMEPQNQTLRGRFRMLQCANRAAKLHQAMLRKLSVQL